MRIKRALVAVGAAATIVAVTTSCSSHTPMQHCEGVRAGIGPAHAYDTIEVATRASSEADYCRLSHAGGGPDHRADVLYNQNDLVVWIS